MRTSFACCTARRQATKTKRGPTSSSRAGCACSENRAHFRTKRSALGAKPRVVASSCCRPARARATWPCWPSTTSGGARSSSLPTLDLVRQWYDLLRTSFGCDVGVVGGGTYDVQPLTVTTYDSACLHMDHFGARFGLVIFDECHHLPGPSYALAAELCLAPFRLGLSATPERSDGQDAKLVRLIGPTVYRKDIVEMTGPYLAEYETVRVEVDLEPRGARRVRGRAGHLPGFRAQPGDPHGQRARLERLHHALGAQASGSAPCARTAVSASYRSARRAKLDYIERLLEAHRTRKGADLHARQRDRLRYLEAFLAADHHASNQGQGAQRDLGALCGRSLPSDRHVESAERGRRRARRQRRDRHQRQRLGARARAAFGPNFASKRRQIRDLVRARLAQDGRGVHERATPRARGLRGRFGVISPDLVRVRKKNGVLSLAKVSPSARLRARALAEAGARGARSQRRTDALGRGRSAVGAREYPPRKEVAVGAEEAGVGRLHVRRATPRWTPHPAARGLLTSGTRAHGAGNRCALRPRRGTGRSSSSSRPVARGRRSWLVCRSAQRRAAAQSTPVRRATASARHARAEVQAVLLCSVRVVVDVRCASADQYRACFTNSNFGNCCSSCQRGTGAAIASKSMGRTACSSR